MKPLHPPHAYQGHYATCTYILGYKCKQMKIWAAQYRHLCKSGLFMSVSWWIPSTQSIGRTAWHEEKQSAIHHPAVRRKPSLQLVLLSLGSWKLSKFACWGKSPMDNICNGSSAGQQHLFENVRTGVCKVVLIHLQPFRLLKLFHISWHLWLMLAHAGLPHAHICFDAFHCVLSEIFR